MYQDYKNVEIVEADLTSFDKKTDTYTELIKRAYFILSEYYSSRSFNEHLAINYSEKLLRLCEEDGDFGMYYFSSLENLIRLEVINRDVVKAQAYAFHYSNAVNLYYANDSILQAKSLAQSGFVLCYLHPSNLALDTLKLALQTLPKNKCLYDRQLILKLILFTCNNTKMWRLYEKYILQLEAEVQYCGDFCNLNKIKGVNQFKKQQYEKSIPYLLLAYDYIVQNKPLDNPQLGSVIYYLYESYLATGAFDKALNTYFTETVEPIPAEIMEWDKNKIFEKSKRESTFYFMTMGYYAKVFYHKYLTLRNTDDLLFASRLIDSSRVLIQNELQHADEDKLLFVFTNSEEVYNLGIQINYELYQLYKNQRYATEVYQYSEENKLKILCALKYADPQQRIHSKKIQRSLDSLKFASYNPNAVITKKSRLTKLDDLYTYRKRPKLLTKIQAELDTDQILIDYNIINEHIYISYISRDTTLIFKQAYNEIQREKVNSLIKWQKDLTADVSELDSLAQEVYSILFPETELPYEIVVIPDQHLLNLSFEVLKNSSSEALIDNHLVSYSGSGEQFFSNKHITHNKVGRIAAFFYSDEESLNKAPIELDPLPGNITENEIIKKSFLDIQIYSGKTNTRSNFVSTINDGAYDIIHIATHGYSSDTNAKDIRLYFRDDSYQLDSMYAYHLLDQELEAKLIILSACHSGAGLYYGGEGKFDWARYFILAGADSVISSLWDVDDRASKLVFSQFYQSNKISFSEKIREAKIRLKDNPIYSHPYYWGGFIYSR